DDHSDAAGNLRPVGSLFERHQRLRVAEPKVPLPVGLVLALRHGHGQAVQLVADLDLAGEAAVGLDVLGEVEHRLLHGGGGAGLVAPGFAHIDVAGGARAGAAAIGV